MKKFLTVNLFLFSQLFLQAQEPELMLPVGHTASFGSLYFSPDGNLVATTAFKEKMVAVWDVRAGKLLATFNDTLAFWSFQKVIFSNDGKKLFTYGGAKMIWDIEKKKLLLDMQSEEENEYSNPASHISFSPDGAKLAFEKNSIAAVMDIASKKIIAAFTNPGYEIQSLLFSPNGKYLAINTKKETIIRSITDSNFLFALGDGGSVFFTPDSKKIVAWKLGELLIYDVDTGSLVKKIGSKPPGELYFNHDYKKVIAIMYERRKDIVYRKALLFDIEKGILLYQWENVSAARFHPDNETVIIIKEGPGKLTKYDDLLPTSYVEIWNSNTFKLIKKWSDNLSLTINDEGNRVAGVTDTIVKVFSAKTGTILREWDWHGHIPNYKTTISPNGKRVVTKSSHINIWNSESGTMLASAFIGYRSDEFENNVNIIYGNDSSTFIATEKANWQIWNSQDAKLLLQSSNNFKGTVIAAISHNNHQAAFIYQNEKQAYLELYDLKLLKRVKKFITSTSPVKAFSFSPDNTKFLISYTEKDNTEIRSASSFSLEKKGAGIIGKGFSSDGTKMITTLSNDSLSYVWNINTGALIIRMPGKAFFSPVESTILTTTGVIWDLENKEPRISINDFDEFWWDEMKGVGVDLDLHFSLDGTKIIGVVINYGSSGQFSSVNVWDAKTGKLMQAPDTAFTYYNDYISRTGRKLVHVPINEDEDLKIIDIDKKDTVWLLNSRTADRARYAEFSPDDKYLFTSNDQTIKKWDVATGRLLFTFFPVDSTAYLTLAPSGYYSCSQDAAKILHYVKGMQIVSFAQLDVRYNRPDKVLEYIGYSDTALIKAYKKAYEKRIKKSGIDTTTFGDGFGMPTADFLNREKIEAEQKTQMLTLYISGNDSTYYLDRFNIWVNEVPVFGMKGIKIDKRHANSFDTVISIKLSQGENRIETSVTNINGTESYRIPLLVKYLPTVKLKESTRFIGIGIDKFVDKQYNLQYSTKDIRDLAIKLKWKYGSTIIIDTLFNENVTVSNVKALKQKLQQTSENDKVIIAYSGHGMLNEEYDYYLSTYSINFEKPSENGLPYDEIENLLDSIPARKKLLLIDACHSGEVDKEDIITLTASSDSLIKGLKPVAYKTEGHLGLKNSFELMQSLFVNVGKSTGATIISAAAGTQFAVERNDLKNGVFTFSILEAMKKYPLMKISQLKKIVGERVVELTKGLQQPTSRNEAITVDWDVW